MKQHWKYIIISLLIGGFLGSALTVCVLHHRGALRGHGPNPIRRKLNHELRLTPEQKAKVDAIMKTSRQKMEEVRRNARADIRKELQPEQQDKFDKLDAQMEQRRKKWAEPGSTP